MRKLFKLVAASVLLMAFQSGHAQIERYVEGVHYNMLEADTKVEPTSDKAGEVVEFFAYACPHCYNFEPFLTNWKENDMPDSVNFIESPISFGRESWSALAQGRHIAERLDVTGTMHNALYKAIHEQGVRVNNLEDVKQIFVDNGVAAEDFDQAANSLQVRSAFRKSEQNAMTYQVSSTPSVMVNGRYMVNSGSLSSYDEVFEVVDFLLQKDGVEVN